MVFAQEQACGHPTGEKGQNDQLRLLIIIQKVSKEHSLLQMLYSCADITLVAFMADRFCQPSPTDCNHPPLTCDMNPFVDDDLENLLTPPGEKPQNVCNLLTPWEGG